MVSCALATGFEPVEGAVAVCEGDAAAVATEAFGEPADCRREAKLAGWVAGILGTAAVGCALVVRLVVACVFVAF